MRKLFLGVSPIVAASLLLAGCATTTPPQANDEIPSLLHGTWTYDASGVHPSDAELPWTVKAKSISGHEFYGEVTSVRIVNPREVVVSSAMSAEGEEFTAVQTLKLSPDGNQLTVTGSEGDPYTLHRIR